MWAASCTKRKKNQKTNGVDESSILALAVVKVELKDTSGLILGFQAAEKEGIEEPG